MKLSTTQLSALRQIDRDPLFGSTRTVDSLTRNGLIERHPVVVGGKRLTEKGRRVLDDYIARTGDGPEHLKARFRAIGL